MFAAAFLLKQKVKQELRTPQYEFLKKKCMALGCNALIVGMTLLVYQKMAKSM